MSNINMKLNSENRVKKFTKDFKKYRSHPNYTDLQSLYSSGAIKTVSGVNKFFEYLRYSKNGTIFKNDKKYLNTLKNLLFQNESLRFMSFDDEIFKPFKVKSNEIKNFHIMCEVLLNVKYNSGKKNQKENINNETFRESRVIKATSFSEAKEIMNEKIRDDYNVEESWRRSTVIKTNFVSVLPITQEVMKSDIKTVRMKDLGTNILNYDSVKEF